MRRGEDLDNFLLIGVAGASKTPRNSQTTPKNTQANSKKKTELCENPPKKHPKTPKMRHYHSMKKPCVIRVRGNFFVIHSYMIFYRRPSILMVSKWNSGPARPGEYRNKTIDLRRKHLSARPEQYRNKPIDLSRKNCHLFKYVLVTFPSKLSISLATRWEEYRNKTIDLG